VALRLNQVRARQLHFDELHAAKTAFRAVNASA